MDALKLLRFSTLTSVLLLIGLYSYAGGLKSFRPGQPWLDTDGHFINAHGGGILFQNGTYYWYGESKDEKVAFALEGVSCYSSKDLYSWKNEGIAFSVVKNDTTHDVTLGCTLERPKVIYNAKTKKYVMWFHLEFRNQGYKKARIGLATSDSPTGPFVFHKSYRPNAGKWPLNFTTDKKVEDFAPAIKTKSIDTKTLSKEGYFFLRDFEGGQMSRDMTIFVDDTGKTYHICASEENQTLQIAELSDDYQSHTGKFIRVAVGNANEAPTIFKRKNRYYMITSGCTGWAPNAGRLLVADSILGEWKILPNPFIGKDSEKSFYSQGTYILPVQGKKDAFIFMADRWNPQNLKFSTHIWLPIRFENDLPVLKWYDKWDLDEL